MKWDELTAKQRRLLKRLPAKVEFGDTVAVELLQAGLAYRKPVTWLVATDAGLALINRGAA